MNLFWIYLEFLNSKNHFLYRTLTCQLMWQSVVTWDHVYTPRGDVCVRMCVRVCVCVHVCVISGLSIIFMILVKPINFHTLYTHQLASIFVMWDYLSLYIFAGDVTQREAFDSRT